MENEAFAPEEQMLHSPCFQKPIFSKIFQNVFLSVNGIRGRVYMDIQHLYANCGDIVWEKRNKKTTVTFGSCASSLINHTDVTNHQ